MKIKIGRESHPRKPFDLSHDVHTTMEWGFVQPTFMTEMVPSSSISCNVGTACRLFPMTAPTFGRCTIKNYAYFVPIRQVCMQFENLLTQTGYSGANITYIPAKVLSTNLAQLSYMCLLNAELEVHEVTQNSERNYVQGVKVTDNATIIAALHALPGSISNSFNPPFVQGDVKPEGADAVLTVAVNSKMYIIYVRFAGRGKRLRKIFIGLGYQINFKSTDALSFLPILAYYKAYFDLFEIKQTKNWQYTNAYRIIQAAAQMNITGIASIQLSILTSFFTDLSNCWYTQNPDYITAHQTSLNYQMTGNTLGVASSAYVSGGSVVVGNGSVQATEQSTSALGSVLSAPILQALMKFYPYINKNTNIGQRVKDLLRAHGLGVADDDKSCHFLGASSVNIDFDDVMSTSDTLNADKTAGSLLGEYAGKGLGGGRSGNIKHSTDTFGYFIVLTCVVPRTSWCQGVNPLLYHGTGDHYDFYHPQFDAVGMQVTSSSVLIGGDDLLLDNTPNRNTNFGLIPRYSEYKCSQRAQNKLNGDFSRRSTMTELMPYTLDRYISPSELRVDRTETSVKLWASFTSINYMSNNLRYIGKEPALGNFNRIFEYNSSLYKTTNPYGDGSLSDDGMELFIVHNMLNVTLIAPMLPMSDSYNTDSFDNAVSINKA